MRSYSKRRRGAIFVAVAIAVAATALVPGSAAANLVTVGSPLTGPFEAIETKAAGTFFNRTLGEPGASAVSPVDGAVVSFHLVRFKKAEGLENKSYTLRILRPEPSGTYTATGTSTPLISGTINPPPMTPLPIEAGDTIGLDMAANTLLAVTYSVPGSTVSSWSPPLAEGSTLRYNGSKKSAELAFNAQIQPRPQITSVSPRLGRFDGVTKVTIRGHDFNDATSVRFGRTEARFWAAGGNRIVAWAPRAKGNRTRRVTVETIAGSSPPSSIARFGIVACKVPHLRQQTLASARRSLAKADCALGGVNFKSHTEAGSAKVVGQRPRAGRVLRPHAKVSIILG